MEKQTTNDKLLSIAKGIEDANPAIFALLATLLPFLTPFPIAALTAISAETYLFSGHVAISWIFVAVLEGLGLLVTSYLTDAVLKYIGSKNTREIWKIFLLGVVTVVYIAILIGLNVQLKAANSEADPAYLLIITLMCFLPLISGVLYGYAKFNRDTKAKESSDEEYNRKLEEKKYEDARKDKMDRYKIKRGVPLVENNFTTSVPSVPQKQEKEPSNSFRNVRKSLTTEELRWIVGATRSQVAKEYKLPSSTARNWISGAQEELDRRNPQTGQEN